MVTRFYPLLSQYRYLEDTIDADRPELSLLGGHAAL